MKHILWGLTLAVGLCLFGMSAHAACPIPNPNASGPPFYDGCELPAAALNRLASVPYFSARAYGAVGDGVTDDGPALQIALNAVGANPGGGILWLPPTGHAYKINTGLHVPGGVIIMGPGTFNSPSTYDNNVADWTATGSWIWSTDTTLPAIRLYGPGAGVIGLNFWQTQPTPNVTTQCANPCTFTGGFTATAYPYIIEVDNTGTGSPTGAANYFTIEQNHIVNAYAGIDIEGADGLSGMYSHFDHDYIGTLGVGLKMFEIDNNLAISDVKFELAWMNYSSDVLNWTEGSASSPGHKIDEDWYYTAGIQQINVEHDFSAIGIRMQNETIHEPFGDLTFAAQGFNLTNEDWNEVCNAMYAPPTDGTNATVVEGNITGGIVNTDFDPSPVAGQCANGTGSHPYAFDLQSDAADISMHNVEGFDVQGLLALGNGTSGVAHLFGVRTTSYSNYTNAGHAFLVNTGANLIVQGDLDNIRTMNSNAGTQMSGSGAAVYGPTYSGQLGIVGPAATAQQILFSHQSTNCAVGGCLPIVDWSAGVDTSGANRAWDIKRYSSGTFVDVPVGVNLSTGLLSANDGILASNVQISSYAIASLPTCNTPMEAFVNNGITSPTFRQTVSTTGSSIQHVVCDGSNWLYE